MRRTGLFVLLCLLVASTALAFNFGFNFKFGGSSGGGYADLQSGMVWQTYTPTPGTYAFGNHSTSTNTDKVFTLSNPGNDLLESASLAVAGSGFSLQSTTCGSNPFDLALLTTCTATVRFSPVAGTSYSGTLTASAPNLTSQVVNLSGTGVVPPVAPSTPVISVTPGDTTNLIALTSGGTGSPTPSYDLKRGTVSGTRSVVASGIALPYTDTGRTNGTPYYYSLVATNSGGSAESSEVSGTPGWRTTRPPFGTGINYSNPVTSGLVVAWAFNDSGTTAVDSVSAINATLVGGSAFSADGVDCNGAGKYVSTPSGSFTSTNGTLVVGHKKVGATNTYGVIAKINGYDTTWSLGRNGSDTSISAYAGGTGINVGVSTSAIYDGLAHNLLWSWGSSTSIYLDGTSIGSGGATSSISNTNPLYFGTANNAAIGYVLIFNRILNNTEKASITTNPWQVWLP